jgi:hypothetical protein
MNHVTYDCEFCTPSAGEYFYPSCVKVFRHFDKCNITCTNLNVNYFTLYIKTAIIIIIIICCCFVVVVVYKWVRLEGGN